MYLSRIELTEAIAEQSQLGLLLKDRSYGMHRLLWDLFTGQERFLFREESSREQLGRTRNLPLFYVLSKEGPALESPIFNIEIKTFSPSLNRGDRLGFRLRANPTIAKRDTEGKPSKRHDVVMDAQRRWLLDACKSRSFPCNGTKTQLRQRLLQHLDFSGKNGELRLAREIEIAVHEAGHNWLSARGEKNGFNLETVQATGYRWNALPEKGRTAGFSSMDYEGVITVSEPEQFKQMLSRGIGPSKAFGCGLMLVRRL
jgi:CRISPR system Cascade subunit CasE